MWKIVSKNIGKVDKIHGKNVTNLVILLKLRYIQKAHKKKSEKNKFFEEKMC